MFEAGGDLTDFLRALIMQRIWKTLHTFVSYFSIKFKHYFHCEECVGTWRQTSILFFVVWMWLSDLKLFMSYIWNSFLSECRILEILKKFFCLVGVVG